MDIVGPIIDPPRIDEHGQLAAGEVLDPRYHVNLAWHGHDPDPTFQASLVVPATPSRGWDVTPTRTAPPVAPPVIPAWKAKAWLQQAGLLEAATSAANAGGPVAQLAFEHAAEWHSTSPLVTALASGLGLSGQQIDQAFAAADAIQG
jgi:hypothetical protein